MIQLHFRGDRGELIYSIYTMQEKCTHNMGILQGSFFFLLCVYEHIDKI